ncbi:MAG: ribosome-binding factor A [Patescibacteria group bacterium]
MPSRRKERSPSLIKKLAAEFIGRNIGLAGVVITVTRVEIKSGFGRIEIFISVWPENKEKEIAAELKESERDFYEYMLKNFKIKYMPSFSFEIDRGEKARLKVEEILKKNRAS